MRVTHPVQAGDTPEHLAAHYAGDSRAVWELVHANPHKPYRHCADGSYTLHTLHPGESVVLPRRWVQRAPLVGVGEDLETAPDPEDVFYGIQDQASREADSALADFQKYQQDPEALARMGENELAHFGEKEIRVALSAAIQASAKSGVMTRAKEVLTGALAGASGGALVATILTTTGILSVAGPVGTIVGAIVGVVIAAVMILAEALNPCEFYVNTGDPARSYNDQSCDDYPNRIQGAINWVKDHTEEALRMEPVDLARMFVIYQWRVGPFGAYSGMGPDARARGLAALPQAKEILQTVQIPALNLLVQSVAQETPELLPMYKTLFRNKAPALDDPTYNLVFDKWMPVHDAMIRRAQQWANSQPARPTDAQLSNAGFSNILLADRSQILDRWHFTGTTADTGKKANLGKPTAEGSAAAAAASRGWNRTTKVAVGVAILGAAAMGGLWWYARRTHQPMGQAARHLVRWPWFKTHRRRNPLELTDGSEKRVAYRVVLGRDAESDRIRMLANGHAMLVRGQEHIRFRPLPYQMAKIRTGEGALLLYTDQLI
jgi:hypothetical protein